jgi:hypothetical protein
MSEAFGRFAWRTSRTRRASLWCSHRQNLDASEPYSFGHSMVGPVLDAFGRTLRYYYQPLRWLFKRWLSSLATRLPCYISHYDSCKWKILTGWFALNPPELPL